ncbi:MAG: hypothetical protein DA443_01630 [Bacteroidetes bacterium]|nr:MAG: hypothetical protein DA443_01630 [Bacteroidota bacterium]
MNRFERIAGLLLICFFGCLLSLAEEAHANAPDMVIVPELAVASGGIMKPELVVAPGMILTEDRAVAPGGALTVDRAIAPDGKSDETTSSSSADDVIVADGANEVGGANGADGADDADGANSADGANDRGGANGADGANDAEPEIVRLFDFEQVLNSLEHELSLGFYLERGIHLSAADMDLLDEIGFQVLEWSDDQLDSGFASSYWERVSERGGRPLWMVRLDRVGFLTPALMKRPDRAGKRPQLGALEDVVSAVSVLDYPDLHAPGFAAAAASRAEQLELAGKALYMRSLGQATPQTEREAAPPPPFRFYSTSLNSPPSVFPSSSTFYHFTPDPDQDLHQTLRDLANLLAYLSKRPPQPNRSQPETQQPTDPSTPGAGPATQPATQQQPTDPSTPGAGPATQPATQQQPTDPSTPGAGPATQPATQQQPTDPQAPGARPSTQPAPQQQTEQQAKPPKDTTLYSNSGQQVVLLIPYGWLRDASKRLPDLIPYFSESLFHTDVPMVNVQPDHSSKQSNWQLLFLLLLAGSFVAHYRLIPSYGLSFSRYFLNHPFFVTDVSEQHIRDILPGLILIVQWLAAQLILTFTFVTLLLQPAQLGLIHSLVQSDTFLSNLFPATDSTVVSLTQIAWQFSFLNALLWVTVLFCTLLIIIQLFWLYLPYRSQRHFHQVLTLLSWPLQVPVLIGSLLVLMITLIPEIVSPAFVVSVFILSNVIPFLIASADLSQIMPVSKWPYRISTGALWLFVLILLWVFLASQPDASEVIGFFFRLG